MRLLSGIPRTEEFHVGNYFGAMKQCAEPQEGEHEDYYFIANYHTLSTVQDARGLRGLTQDVAIGFLGSGIDPEPGVLFRRSNVPQVAERTWLLSCITPLACWSRAMHTTT